jgi:ribosomal protein L11 methylase PrmA
MFRRDARLFRQVNQVCKEDYDQLMHSGLYAALVKQGRLVAHEEVTDVPLEPLRAYKVLRPEPVPFVSYPYEWCFSQLKDAALLTLEVQKTALASGMSLKDATAFNVQFRGTQPVLIDTLSFERYQEGVPWVAYRQFCQHFLAPLAVMSFTDVRLHQLLRTHLEGLPLDLACALLPWSSRLRPSLLLHLHLHARVQRGWAGKAEPPAPRKFSKNALLGLIDSLESGVRGLRWLPRGTEWADYYQCHAYAPETFAHKRELVGEFLDRLRPATVWDLGANTGEFSRLASNRGVRTVAFDFDPACVERGYQDAAGRGDRNLLPLVLDLTNPSPDLGWRNLERLSLFARGPADLALALGLIHHLAISANVPLESIADFLASVCRRLLIEFVPKADPQVARLLATRKDIFPDYAQEPFEVAFGDRFELEDRRTLVGGMRTLYLFRRKEQA